MRDGREELQSGAAPTLALPFPAGVMLGKLARHPVRRGADAPIWKLAKHHPPSERSLLSSGSQADVGLSKVGGCVK